jgi:molybdopterin converting factor small subunit
MGMDIELRFFAAARAAAKTASISVEPSQLSTILNQLCSENSELARVIPQCSFLLNSLAVHDLDIQVEAGSVIDVLPRFAGG